MNVSMECNHDWCDVCNGYHIRLGIEGPVSVCYKCNKIGFRKSNDETPIPVNGRDVYQTEYQSDGRPREIWDAHL